MILNVKYAEYKEGFKIFLTFNNEESVLVDLEDSLLKDSRKIFIPLRDIAYFKTFQIRFNAIAWDNEAGFASEFLIELGREQVSK